MACVLVIMCAWLVSRWLVGLYGGLEHAGCTVASCEQAVSQELTSKPCFTNCLKDRPVQHTFGPRDVFSGQGQAVACLHPSVGPCRACVPNQMSVGPCSCFRAAQLYGVCRGAHAIFNEFQFVVGCGAG